MTTHSLSAVRSRIERLERNFGGRVGVSVRDRDGHELFAHRHNEPRITASTIKTLILVAVLAAERRGEVRLDEELETSPRHHLPGAGVLSELHSTTRLNILDLCRLMIVVSDNVATALLLERVGGPPSVVATAREFGLSSVHMTCGVDHAALRVDPRRFGVASPADLSLLMTGLRKGEVVDPHASQVILRIMSRQQQLDQFPRFLDCSRYAAATGVAASVEVACKTGEWPGARADMGWLGWQEGELTYAVMCEGSQDLSIGPDSEPALVVALTALLLMQTIAPQTLTSPLPPHATQHPLLQGT